MKEQRINKESKSFKRKIIILGIGDVLAILFLIMLFGRMQLLANDIKKMRSEQVKLTPVNIDTIRKELVEAQEKNKKLEALFPDEVGLVNFVNEIDAIKEDKILTGFSFANNVPLKDKLGYSGLPVLLRFKGSLSEINNALAKVQALPYLLRPIDIKISSQEATGSAILDYGGLLYVNENFGKN
jgi:Tfp pilus assembly protein PilO